ncbi:hypothetical protein ISS08_00085 [Candidatus Pacearchaeota archaeon]|nr:hypothetical protein [Candidatus Pacearchaeota archaeon]
MANQKSIIVDKAMKALGISLNMKTDPKEIRAVLREMKLDTFRTEYKPLKLFLDKISNHPQPLKQMFLNIKHGIITKHPAVLEFIEEALGKNWFSKSKHIEKAIHVTFVFEALTAAMANNNAFFIEIQNYLLNKRKEYGVITSSLINTFWKVWCATGSIFLATKVVSLDPAVTFFRFKREQDKKKLNKKFIKSLYKNKKLNYPEYRIVLDSLKKSGKSDFKGLRLNIYEAGITEYKKGFENNAMCAHALTEELKKNTRKQIFKKGNIFPEKMSGNFYNSLKNKNNFSSTIPFSKKWVNLYETWNMAFILSDLENLDIIFPKLLIPSVINTKSENYMTTRVMALWLSINTLLFRRLDHKKEVKGPKNKKEMAQAWGKINKKYALDLSKKETKIDSKSFNKSFKKSFRWPMFTLIKLI